MFTYQQLLKSTFMAFIVLGMAACSSTSETDDAEDQAQESQQESDAAEAARMAEQEALEREQQEQAAQDRIDEAALNTTTFYFDFDVAEFQPADRETLMAHAESLANNPDKEIRLEGHADERGTREYNLALGERRANNIRDFLIVNGASRSQIETVSYGEERPAVEGQTEEAYAQNRRVELVVTQEG